MILQRTIDTYVGYYDFAVSGGAIGTINLQVPIPTNTVYCEFAVINFVSPTSAGAATISFDLLVTSVFPNTLVVGKFLAATAIAGFGVPNDVLYGVRPGAAAAPFKLVAASSVAMSIAVAALTAGKLQFYIRCVSFDF